MEGSGWANPLLPKHQAFPDCAGSVAPRFCCPVSSLWSQMSLWDFQQHLRQSSAMEQTLQRTVFSEGCRNLSWCSQSPWENTQGRSCIPTEWSQVTGMKQSWICCSGGCWWSCMAAAGNEMRDVSSPFGRMQSLIWFGFP